MADEEEQQQQPAEEKSKTPLFCGLTCILSLLVLLFFTELIFDASVRLNKWLLICTIILCLVPLVIQYTCNNKITRIISIIITIVVFSLLILLCFRRNRVSKFFLLEGELDDKNIQKFKNMMAQPHIVVLAGNVPKELPDDLKKYSGASKQEILAFNSRFGKTQGDAATDTIEYTPEQLQATRLSGIMRNQIIVVKGDDINKSNYKDQGFVLLQ